MQTVLDIIRHYSGAGKEDKDMTHECEGVEKGKIEVDKAPRGGWFLWTIAPAGDWSLTNNDVEIDIKYCPFCGMELDES